MAEAGIPAPRRLSNYVMKPQFKVDSGRNEARNWRFILRQLELQQERGSELSFYIWVEKCCAIFPRVYIHSCKWTFRTERFKFHSAATNSSEGFLSYLTRLKKLARSCNFDNYSTGDAIVHHYICACGSNTVKRKLLSNESLDLATMTLKVSSIELVESQVKVMDHKPNLWRSQWDK